MKIDVEVKSANVQKLIAQVRSLREISFLINEKYETVMVSRNLKNINETRIEGKYLKAAMASRSVLSQSVWL
ncbi:MAG: hypothetical protein VXZ38_03900 [Planctomycetota bacterium]|nr:hypothetical protein [Planctomycetota bacterium]